MDIYGLVKASGLWDYRHGDPPMKKMQARRTAKNKAKTHVKQASKKKSHYAKGSITKPGKPTRSPRIDGQHPFVKRRAKDVDSTGNKGVDQYREAPHRRPRRNRTDTESRPREHRMHTEPKTGIRYGSVDVTDA